MNKQGASNRLVYDECAYAQRMSDSTSPFQYRTYMGAYENSEKCKYDKFWKPFDGEIVDVESELKNITRPATKCANLKYNPACKKSAMCTSTYDPSRPVILNVDVCPVVYNNIPRQTSNGMRPVLGLEGGNGKQ
jgi:hypothetical protein